MEIKNYVLTFVIALFVISCTILTDAGKEKFYNPDIWATAYLASWKHYAPPEGNWGNLPTSEINWDNFTHMVYFTFLPNSDGSVADVQSVENLNKSRLSAIVEAAHKNETPILYTVGGWNTRNEFLGAMSDSNREAFIDNLVQVLNEWNFDGIDINMEPIREEDRETYMQFITELHARLQDQETPLLSTPLLTAAVRWQPELFGELQDNFDQINIMTYDMSGTWEGWVTWHNSPLFNGGNTFPGSTDRQLPSVNKNVQDYLEAGVDRNKLGIGIDFYGYVWEGVSEPMENWSENNEPDLSPEGGVPYHDLYNNYNLEDSEWDKDAKVPYVSIEDPETFISFDNKRSVREKIKYAKNNSLGGAMIWELGGGYRSNAPENEKDNLLEAIKRELEKE